MFEGRAAISATSTATAPCGPRRGNMPGSEPISHPIRFKVVAMNDPPVLQPLVAKVAALIDERAPLDELDRAWAVLLRLWNAVERSAPPSAPAGDP